MEDQKDKIAEMEKKLQENLGLLDLSSEHVILNKHFLQVIL
jgi:hypothetical protein